MVILITLLGVLSVVAGGGVLLWWADMTPERRAQLPTMHPLIKTALMAVFLLAMAAVCLMIAVAVQSFADLNS